MTDLAGQLLRPVDVVGRSLLLGDRVRVVGDPQEAKPGQDREQLAVLPVAGKLLELRKVIGEIVIRRVQLLDVPGGVQLLNVFGIRQDDVEGPWRRLGDQPKHIVAARIVLRLELYVVLSLEGGDDIGLGVAVPGEHGELNRLSEGTAVEEWRGEDATGESRCPLEEVAACPERQAEVGHLRFSTLF